MLLAALKMVCNNWLFEKRKRKHLLQIYFSYSLGNILLLLCSNIILGAAETRTEKTDEIVASWKRKEL